MDESVISSVISTNEPAITHSEALNGEAKPAIIENGKMAEDPAANEKITVEIPIKTAPDLTKLTADLQAARKDKEELMEDRESLLKILERRNLEIERLENESKNLRRQLKTAVESKCEAVTKFDEIQHKIKQIEFKERRFEEDKAMLEEQIENLSSDLARNIQQLQQSRRDSTTHILTLEAKFHEKNEEVSISSRQIANLKEANTSLTSQVEELSQKLLKFNEDYSSTIHKYQQELKAKTRLAELYKEKNDDVMSEQRDVANVVAELRSALNEATEEFGKLETSSKLKESKFESEKEEMLKMIKNLQSQLENARRENIETSLDQLLSPTAVRRLSGKSLTEIFTLHIQSTEQLEKLTMEHEALKSTYSEIVREIRENGPKIQQTQIDLERIRNAYESLKIKNEILLHERSETFAEVELLSSEVQELRRNLEEAQDDRKDLSRQICHLLKRGAGRNESCDFVTFESVEELQDNNIKLVALVRELSAAIEKQEKDHILAEEMTSLNRRRSHASSTPQQAVAHLTSISTQTDYQHVESPTEKLQSELTDTKSQLQAYRTKKEKLSEQLDTLRDKFSEISATNFKLKAQNEQQEGLMKVQQKNVEMFKQKLQTAEERLQNSTTTNVKLETILANLNAEMQNAEINLRNLRRKNEHLSQQNQSLIRNEAKLRSDCESLEQQNSLQAHMMSSLEFIKASLERGENETKAKINEKFDEINEICAQLRGQLEEERKQFGDFERQANETIAEKEDEAMQLHQALTKAYEDLEKFSQSQSSDEVLIQNQLQDFVTASEGVLEPAMSFETINEEEETNGKKRSRELDDEDEENLEKRAKIVSFKVADESSVRCNYLLW